MANLVNPVRARLARGELALGVGLRQSRTVDIAPAMKSSGYDWLFIDLEHNSMTVDQAVQISVAANGVGIAPIVRVPAGQYDMATRVLDGGAMGIVVPHVDTADEARTIADRLRYPPTGHRSVAGAMPQLGFARLPLAEAAKAVNEALLVVVMLETPLAVENADAIAAVPGIDALLTGTNDLTMEMGIPGQLGHPRVISAYEVIIAACRRHGKIPAMGGVYAPELMAKYVGMGMRMLLCGSDLTFMMEMAASRADFLRDLKP